MKIYLLSNEKFENVENIILNKIKYFDYKLNDDFDILITTSKNALKKFENFKDENIFLKTLYVLSEKSANYAKNLGFKDIKFPNKSYAKDLFLEFKDEFKNKKCVYLRAKIIASNLDKYLLDYGVNLKQIISYENIAIKPNITNITHPCIIIFTSSSSVDNFLKYFQIKKEDVLIAIGKQSSKKLLNHKNLIVSEKQDLKACVDLAIKIRESF